MNVSGTVAGETAGTADEKTRGEIGFASGVACNPANKKFKGGDEK